MSAGAEEAEVPKYDIPIESRTSKRLGVCAFAAPTHAEMPRITKPMAARCLPVDLW
jgi:hypothetical protein